MPWPASFASPLIHLPQAPTTAAVRSRRRRTACRPQSSSSTPSQLAASDAFDHPPRGRAPAGPQPGVSPAGAGVEAGVGKTRTGGRIAFGFAMGFVVIAVIFSGPWAFAVGLAASAVLGQQEYYQMVKAKGHLPATRLGRLTTLLIILMSVVEPSLAEAAFATGGAFICLYLLFRRRPRQASIADVSTTFMGLFYAGYLPTFWVRLHGFDFAPDSATPGARLAARLMASGAFSLPAWVPRPTVHRGAVVVFWSLLANAFADIGAFVTGKAFGRTRLIAISPKKTVEGAVGGIICSTSISICAAYLMGWPLWQVTGFLYGITLGVVGLLGDLTESLFKRDAGVKDSGDLIPGHGGILDRTDSYVFIAPLAYYIVTLLLPATRRLLR